MLKVGHLVCAAGIYLASLAIALATTIGVPVDVTITIVNPGTAGPINLTLTPSAVSVLDSSAAGLSLSTVSVSMADGSPFTGTLTSSNPALVGISGSSLVLGKNLASGDDGFYNVAITATVIPPPPPPPPPVPTSFAPPPAVAAGFTTLAIDYDFTQPNPWSNRSNWLRCHDGSGASNPLLYQDWIGFGGFQMPSCSNITQATDPLGSLALHVHMDKASLNAMGCEPNCGGKVIAMTLQTVDSAGNGNQLPPNAYVEVIGMPRSSDPSMSSLFADFWSYSRDSSVEWDGIEFFGNNIGFATYHNNSSGNVFSTNASESMDQSAYHKYAWRVTSDGHSDGYFCSYLDDAPVASAPGNCISWSPTSTQLTNPDNATVQFETGFAGCGDGSFCPNSSVELWVRHLRVWTCANINSGAKCHTPSANP